MAKATVSISKQKVKLDSYTDTFVVGYNSLVINNYNRPVNVFGYSPKGGHKYARTVDVAVHYNNPHIGQKCILMTNQAIRSGQQSLVTHEMLSELCATE